MILGMSVPIPFLVPVLSSCSDDKPATVEPTSPPSTRTPESTVAGTATAAPPTATTVADLNCVATPQQTEGPYFVDEGLERSDIRANPGSADVRPGVPLKLALGVYRVEGQTCSPLAGAHVDLWQCDAAGVYSDVAANNSVGQKFLRGHQVTDGFGKAAFTTIYPGWYQGRTVHIHFKVRTYDGSNTTHEFTSQFFFDDALTDEVFKQAPYNTRGARNTRNNNDGIFTGAATDGSVARNSGDSLLLRLTPDGTGYASQFSIGIDLTRQATDAGPSGGGRPPAR